MKIVQNFFFLLIGISLPLFAFAGQDEEDIIVSLDTDSPLVPLYFMPSMKDSPAYSADYIKQLEEVLKFDLTHNGSTFIAKKTLSNDRLPSSGDFKDLGIIQDWKDQNISYVVKLKFSGPSLTAMMLNANSKTFNNTEPFPLTGNLNQDRRQIHRLADLIHKAFFGVNGIATTKIIYTVKDNQKGISEIWESDYDGANARQLTTDNSECITPTYLPPKPGFASGGFMYVSYQLGQPKIFISSFKNPKASRLTYMGGNQLMPAISRQRDKVAFIGDATGNPDLFLQPFSLEQGAQGKPQQIFSARPASQGTPTFSPDGKQIAFVSNKDGSPRIYVMSIPAAGTNVKDIQPKLITKRNRESTAPSWSPDGTKIAYCAKQGGDRQIWVYDFATNQEKQLTQGAGHKENPTWAPNSLHLAFNSANGKKSELYFINLNQTDVTPITSGFGEKRFPSWEPRAN